MRANWCGLAEERVHDLASAGSAAARCISGIPGSPTDHHGVPYALTEEFVAVYRMHPLIPDDYELRDVGRTRSYEDLEFVDLHGPAARRAVAARRRRVRPVLLASARRTRARCTLHNFPRFMQEFCGATTASSIDLAAIDILRSRERGVPRYNEFRRLLHLRAPAQRSRSSSDDPATVARAARGLRRTSSRTST